MPKYAFVSHSSKDNIFVEQLSHELKEVGIWADLWDMDLGDPLVEKIEKGIENASDFIIILSKDSIASRWVTYESHMAIIRNLEDSGFRIIAVRIDDCKIPLRFRPFLYVDVPNDPSLAVSRLKEFLSRHNDAPEGAEVLFRRHFVNRTDELGLIERHVADPDIRIICLNGFFGIGKSTLVKEAASRLWQRPNLVIISLSAAHLGPRLALELCANAGVPLPPDGASAVELTRSALLAVETLVASSKVIVFNQFEAILDEDGAPSNDVMQILTHLMTLAACSRVPVFILSRRWPRLSPSISRSRIGDVRVVGMNPRNLAVILENEISRIQRKHYDDPDKIVEVAAHLFGYPLAGRLAAPLLVKYSPDYLLANIRHIESLRADIAEAIVAQLTFRESTAHILELLAIFDGSLSAVQLAQVSGQHPDVVLEDIDLLADHNLIEPDGIAIRLHSLVADFLWKRVRSRPHFQDLAKRLAVVAREALVNSEPGSLAYVHWLTSTCRLLFVSGDLEGGRQLRRDLLGELKVVAIELYQRHAYEVSLRYCDEYLDSDPSDFEIRYHKARNLSRLERFHEGHKILDQMLSERNSTPRRVARLCYAKGRSLLEQGQLKLAREWFMRSLTSSPRYVPALQGISEVLLRLDLVDESAEFLRKALDESPMDSFANSLYADVLWRQGHHERAIDVMALAVSMQPNNASFLFRMGRFQQRAGTLKDAYALFKRAKESDPTYYDASLSLANIAIDLGYFGEAKGEIDELQTKVTGDKRRILRNIEAEYELAVGDLEKANELASQNLQANRDVVTLGLVAKINIVMAERYVQQGFLVLAALHKSQAEARVQEGLSAERNNPQLRVQWERIQQMGI